MWIYFDDNYHGNCVYESKSERAKAKRWSMWVLACCSMQQYAPLVFVQCKKSVGRMNESSILYSEHFCVFFCCCWITLAGLCIYANVGTKIKHHIACKNRVGCICRHISVCRLCKRQSQLGFHDRLAVRI